MVNHSLVQHQDFQQGTVLQFPKSERQSHACSGLYVDEKTQSNPDSSLKQQASLSHAQSKMPEFEADTTFPSEPQRMFKPEQGYTRLPNLLIDEQIMAQLNDKAFKCLMLIVRQTVGFDRAWQRISIGQFQQACGIKKRDTVMRCVADLEACQIIEVKRKTGCLNDFCFTPQHFQSALLTTPVVQSQQTESKPVHSKHVQLKQAESKQAQSQSAQSQQLESKPVYLQSVCQVTPVVNQGMVGQENLTRPVQQDGTGPVEWEGSRPIQRDTIKQNLKENLKDVDVSPERMELSAERLDVSPEREAFKSQPNVMLGFVKYFPQDTQRYSLEQLCQHYQTQQDFLAQAQTSYPQIPLEHLQDMWQQMAQWSLTRMVGKQPQQWMNTWLNWIKNNAHKYHPAASLQTSVQSSAHQQQAIHQEQIGKTGQAQFKQGQFRENQFKQSQQSMQKRSNKAQEFDDFFAKHSVIEGGLIEDSFAQNGFSQNSFSQNSPRQVFAEQTLTQKRPTVDVCVQDFKEQDFSTQHLITQVGKPLSDTATSVFEGSAVTEILEDGS